MHLFVDVRIRLRWMRITGANVSSVNEVELYRDDGSTESCGPYAKKDTSVNIGTSPCDDILLIPVFNTHLFRYVKISVPDYLNLCEVLVYAGTIGCLKLGDQTKNIRRRRTILLSRLCTFEVIPTKPFVNMFV